MWFLGAALQVKNIVNVAPHEGQPVHVSFTHLHHVALAEVVHDLLDCIDDLPSGGVFAGCLRCVRTERLYTNEKKNRGRVYTLAPGCDVGEVLSGGGRGVVGKSHVPRLSYTRLLCRPQSTACCVVHHAQHLQDITCYPIRDAAASLSWTLQRLGK